MSGCPALSLSLPDSLRSGGIPSDFIVVHQPQAQPQADMQEKLQAPTAHFDLENEYKSYINAAFRSSKESQAYLFVGNNYVVLDYSQGPSHSEVVEGPLPFCHGFPFLRFTFFVEYELDAAFGSGENEAIFFLGDECAKINYSSNPSRDIKQITEMFPFLQRTLFESNIDTALESWKSNEAFLFKDDQCVCINYSSDNCGLVGTSRPIVEFFPILKDTFFDSGIQAAFAKSITNCYCYEVVLFKKNRWAWIKFGSLTRRFETPSLHIGQLCPSLRNIVSRKNGGFDGHGIHCGCVPNPPTGSTRRIYTPEEMEWLKAAGERNHRSGKYVAFADLCRELEEAIANKSNIGS
ncbi:albumin-2-like [Rhododendron vialii]|uniref:albumin-2-like n=1 Tax=Rhododendron vialii TaxID=182163 RepID=UPI00265F15ED|nr:albumin-2-like [Rhododendron vialii]